eukprot:11758084-Ditylum_brightwellii.AAC.1
MSGHNTGHWTNQAKDRTLARPQAPPVPSQTPAVYMYTLYTCKTGVHTPTVLVQVSWAVH